MTDEKIIGKYHRKFKCTRIEIGDLETLRKVISEKPTFEQRIEIIDGFAKDILSKYKPNDDIESEHGLAARIVTQIQMNSSQGVSPLRCLKIGMLYERLLALLYHNSKTERTNAKRTIWREIAAKFYFDGSPKFDSYSDSKAANKVMEKYEKEHGKFPRTKRSLENLIREIRAVKNNQNR